ncbi:fungal-specific transcription factor domain-containing protein [Pseudomassariella vexata]|uniref:Fungal-specific transcription factor domain-containing protein n=1 Tax=Pseudomassariella vexata TaxID=1141098 RepID=A0A1Y2E8D4_9PEZI|nr:fungal-specific transcription factor domain-containing protein [Pseudomassariella vexata]ORY67802.1 fungal-specific transcription factor domain-containing protein [Pseudomassariella vexata]
MDQSPRYVRVRVANACDSCKARKVKCDGESPCGYCTRHHRAHQCHFSPQRRRRTNDPRSPRASSASRSVPSSARPRPESPRLPASTPSAPVATTPNRGPGDVSAEEEADVPRDARLLCDAQGKLIFIGDCAPLSFFQTVRKLVTSRVDPSAFAPQASRASLLENAHSNQAAAGEPQSPHVDATAVASAVANYLAVTSGLVDLFDSSRLADEITSWAAQPQKPHDITCAINYLVLAIGLQKSDEAAAARHFEQGKKLALGFIGGDLSVGTVQAFTLVTLYMLMTCQITGAFLFFGIAVRALYSLGVHRTEVNSRFGADIQKQRDRLWKSLRVVDLFLSISMGRPPATSDVDCTVSYRTVDHEGREVFDLLNASVQILLITEGIVLEVYSRKKISMQLTEGISRQLRDWSNRWLATLKRIIGLPSNQHDEPTVVGALQVLSSYYYAVMLVSRPFLMYEMCRRLPQNPSSFQASGEGGSSGRSKLAHACIDAASLMIEAVSESIQGGLLGGKMPLIVSWLFSASLVVGVGLLGEFGRILEKYACMSITALNYFAKDDTHAAQYSLIVNSLHSSTTAYLVKKEKHERLQINESSSQLFGLIPRARREPRKEPRNDSTTRSQSNIAQPVALPNAESTIAEMPSLTQMLGESPFDNLDPALFSFTDLSSGTSDFSMLNSNAQDQADQVFGALNLFPLLDGGGHIDLEHFL